MRDEWKQQAFLGRKQKDHMSEALHTEISHTYNDTYTRIDENIWSGQRERWRMGYALLRHGFKSENTI